MVINTLVVQVTNLLFCLPALGRTWLGHLTLNVGYHDLCKSVLTSKPPYTVCQECWPASVGSVDTCCLYLWNICRRYLTSR